MLSILLLLILLLLHTVERHYKTLYVFADNISGPSRVYLQEKTIEPGSITIIFVEFNTDSQTTTKYNSDNTTLLIEFGPCARIKMQDINTLGGNIKSSINEDYNRNMLVLGKIPMPTATTAKTLRRYLWTIPADIPYKDGCLFVTHNSIIAQSERYLTSRQKHNPSSYHHNDVINIKEEIYFDATHYYHQAKGVCTSNRMINTSTNTNRQMVFNLDDDSYTQNPKKQKKIGIIGAGAAGLFSAYLLEQAGFSNYEILEANNRVGGRIQTVFFDDLKTSYQELGAMRIPYTFKHKNKILPLNDQAVVFQLAKELNELNQQDEAHRIEFVPWKQSTDKDPIELAYEVNNATQQFLNGSYMDSMVTNFFEAYKQTLEKGYGDWSELDWLHNHLNVSLNATEYHLGVSRYPEIWTNMYDMFFHKKTYEWRTIRGGMDRFPNAFLPIIGDKIIYNVKVSKVEYAQQHNEDDSSSKQKVSVQWKNHPFDQMYQHQTFDHVIISVPFILLRSWHLPQELPYTLKRAIKNLEHGDSCKVILEFRTPFWQHYEKPILGGCDSNDLPIGLVCYPTVMAPSDKDIIGPEQPGLLIASYANDRHTRFSHMTEQEHIGRVLEYIQELHGNDIVREQFTGRYARKCWGSDSYAGCAWADPSPGQRKLFLSSYFKDYTQGLVFIGEHTDIKQSWISSALHSAIRGVIMILVENGYIQEAKQLAQRWNATHWLKI